MTRAAGRRTHPDCRDVIIPGENHSYTVSPGYAVNLVTAWLIIEPKQPL